MVRRIALYFAGTILLLAGIALILFIWNRAPHVARVEPAVLQASSRPYVIKVHAQWCPVCMMTKGTWNQVQAAYAGRVNLVVFDVTDSASEQASRAEADRLGLRAFFDDYSGSTGNVYIVAGHTKALVASVQGSRDFADYSKPIDKALKAEN